MILRRDSVQGVVKTWMICFLIAIGLSLSGPALRSSAQQLQVQVSPVQVPPGSTLRATLDGKTIDAKVEEKFRIVESRFGRKEQGRFVAYPKDQPLPYDKPFMIQIHFSSEPPFRQTTVILKWENGGRTDVPVYKNGRDPKIFESEEHRFEDPSACKGIRFCVEGAEENSWRLEQ